MKSVRGYKMIDEDALERIKEELTLLVGKKIVLKSHRSRKKEITTEGVVESIYPFFFVVSIEERNRKVSFSYVDLLTKAVELVSIGA